MGDNNHPTLHQAIEQNDIELVKELIQQGHNTYLQNELGMNSLHLAVDKGHYEIVKLLAEYELHINSTRGPSKCSNISYQGYTPLHLSSKNGDEQITKYLLSKSAKTYKQEKQSGNTPLHLAILKKATNIVHLFLKNEEIASVWHQNYSQESVLHIAAASGYEAVIEDLLELGADNNLPDIKGNTPLHLACENGNRIVVQQLLRYNSEVVNAQNKKLRTPLHNTVYKNDHHLTKILLEFKAKTWLTDEDGNTPLHIACQSNNFKNVQLLIDQGASVNARNVQEKTPMNMVVDVYSIYLPEANENEASCNESLDKNTGMIINLLLQNGACLYISDKLGNTPLHWAVFYGNLEYIDYFLNNDAGIVNYINCERKTPLIIASENNTVDSVANSTDDRDIQDRNTKVIELLLKYKANPDLCDTHGNTPLHYACINNNLEHVKLFLKHGSSINAQNNIGKTPILIAAQTKSSELVKSFSGENLYDGFHVRNFNIVVELLKHGADLNITDDCGNTPLHYACINDNLKKVQLFINHNCRINAQNNEGETAMQIAVKYMSKNVEDPLFTNSKCLSENAKIIEIILEKSGISTLLDEFGNTLLHHACASNNRNLVFMALDSNCNVNIQNNHGKTALTVAAEYLPTQSTERNLEEDGKSQAENDHIIDILLTSGADVNTKDELGNTPLHYACLNNKSGHVKDFLRQGYIVNTQNNAKQTALLIATDYQLIKSSTLRSEKNIIDMQEKNSEIVELLLQFEADAALCDEFKNTPLHFACINNNLKHVEMILNRSVDVNQINIDECTALHIVTQTLSLENSYCIDFQKNNLKIMELLLNSRSDAKLFDKLRNTPLHYACKNNNFKQVQLLLKYNCCVNFKNINDKTALHLAVSHQFTSSIKTTTDCKRQNIEIVKALLEAGADAKLSDEFGNIPLHYACINNNLECVKLLIKNGCDIDSENNEGKTALNLLIETQSCNSSSLSTEQCDPNSEQTIEQFLLDSGANVNTSDNLRNKPLHYACLNNNLDHVKLLQKDIFFDYKNEYGETALIIAAKQTQLDSVVTANRLYDIVKIICPYYGYSYKLQNSNDRTEYIRQRDMFGNTVFHYACSNSHLECVKYLIDECEINARNNEGKTPLHMAAEMRSNQRTPNESVSQNGAQLDVQSRNTQIIDILIEKGADIKLFDNFGNTALHYACINNSFSNVEKLVERYKIDRKNHEGKTALHIATQKPWLHFPMSSEEKRRNLENNKHIVELLLKSKADVNLCDKFGNTALHYAFINNDLEYVQLFVTHHCKVNSRNKDGKTALHFLAENRASRNSDKRFQTIDKQCLNLFFTYGADPNFCDNLGNTPLHYACINNSLDTVHFFVKHGCSINYQNGDRKSALIIAAENRVTRLVDSVDKEITNSEFHEENIQIIDFLLTSGANTKLFDKHGNTALHYACINGNIDQVRRLLNRGCDVNHQNGDKKSPLIIATERTFELAESLSHKDPDGGGYVKQEQIVDLLLNSGANTNLYDNRGNTALHYACNNDNIKQVRRFLKYGCDVFTTNKNNKRALDIATDNNSNDILDLLKKYYTTKIA